MDLSDDSVRDVCRQMGVRQLYNFVQTNSRNYNLCKDILSSRRREYELARLLQSKRCAMKYDTFKYITINNIGIDLSTMSDKVILDSWRGEIYDIDTGSLFEAVTNYPQITTDVQIDISNVYELGNVLRDDIRPYINIVTQLMMTNTKYVKGTTIDGDLDIIEMPFDSDVGNIIVEDRKIDYITKENIIEYILFPYEIIMRSRYL